MPLREFPAPSAARAVRTYIAFGTAERFTLSESENTCVRPWRFATGSKSNPCSTLPLLASAKRTSILATSLLGRKFGSVSLPRRVNRTSVNLFTELPFLTLSLVTFVVGGWTS